MDECEVRRLQGAVEESGSGQHGGQESGAQRHGLVENIFLRRVGAVTDSAKAIESGDTESSGEVAVGAATSRSFAERKAHLLGERFGAEKKSGAVLALERRAVKTAADFEFCATTNRLQRTEALLQCAHVRDTPGAKIEIDFGAVGDDVGARAAIDDIGVDGDAVTRIVPFFDASNLRSEFVNSVDAPFRVETGVGGTAVNHEFGFTDALARGLDQSARTEGRLEHEDGVAAARIFLNQLAGGFAADLFVGGPEKDETLGDRMLATPARASRAKSAWTMPAFMSKVPGP